MSWGLFGGRVWDGLQSAVPPGDIFLKQCLKRGFLMHSEKIVEEGGGHWISSLCTV